MKIQIKEEIKDLEVLLGQLDEKKDRWVLDFTKQHWHSQIIPNWLTAGQIGIGALLLLAVFNLRIDNGLFLAPIFLAGALAYFLNQALAKESGHQTAFGKIANPIADRILTLPIIFYSLISYNKTLFFLLMLTEIINALISLYALDKPIVIKRTIFAKSKTTLQLIILAGVLVFWPHSPNVFFVAMLWLSLIFMVISIIFKVMAATSYLYVKNPKNLQHPIRQERGIKAA